MTNTKINVLVTAVGGGGVGEQILKAFSLANNESQRYYVIAADMNPYCPQFQNADEAICVPRVSDENYIDALIAICTKKACIAIFPGSEVELTKLSANREVFAENGILLMINPVSVIDICMDKAATGKVLTEMGFNPPQYIEVTNADELSAVDWFPVVIKPSIGGGGSAHSYIAQNHEELRYLILYLNKALPGQSFIIQEYVGDENSEYTVGVLHDLDGNYINSIAIKRELKSQLNVRAKYKNNTDRKDLGDFLIISSGISHGTVGKFPVVTSRCREIAKAIGAKGPINIQLRLVGDDIKVFEINPRFSGTTSLRAMNGYNEPDILLRKHIFGETIEEDFKFKESMILRHISETEVPTDPARSWKDYVAGKQGG